MKNIFLIGILVFSFKATGQNDTLTQLPERIACGKPFALQAKQNFEADLRSKKIEIHLMGGIVSVIRKEDHDFEKQYGIQYNDFGCVIPGNLDFYKAYNALVFEYLTKQFGNNWREAINTNAVGWRN